MQGDSLGAQLRRRRRELGLRRVDAAALLGTSWKSLMWWERDEREPAAPFYPAIIRFLKREPWPVPVTLADRLRAERRRRGLSQIAAARFMEVDPEVMRRWESGEWKPSKVTVGKLAAFLRTTVESLK